MILHAIKADQDNSNLLEYLEDELTYLYKNRIKRKEATSREHLLFDTLNSMSDISNINLQHYLIEQLNNVKTNLWPKEELMLKILKRNNNLD